jgi:uncharacterized protein
MPIPMKEEEVEKMLNGEALGRLGCYAHGKMFVVPINFGYDGNCLYAHSKEGQKISMMRENAKVCFEIDRTEPDGSWHSVILWGEYEELTTVKAQRAGMKVYTAQMARLIPNQKAMPSHGFVKGANKFNDPFKSVVFRIRITEKTGRKERK